jgi:hypothetical protein
VSNATDKLKKLLDNIDLDGIVQDFYGLTKTERVKYFIEISKLLQDQHDNSGKVVVELVYPKDERTDTSKEAA